MVGVSCYLEPGNLAGERLMSRRGHTALVLLVAATTTNCRDASAPLPPNVRATTNPKLAANFAHLR